MNECKRSVSPRKPSTSRDQISCDHCEGKNIREYHDWLRNEFKRTTSQIGSFSSTYPSFFPGYCFTCNIFGHEAIDCRLYGINVQARDYYVAPYNIECYKFHNMDT